MILKNKFFFQNFYYPEYHLVHHTNLEIFQSIKVQFQND